MLEIIDEGTSDFSNNSRLFSHHFFQHTDDIIIFDPSGSCGLALTGYEKVENQADVYTKCNSTIYYFKTIEEFLLL